MEKPTRRDRLSEMVHVLQVPFFRSKYRFAWTHMKPQLLFLGALLSFAALLGCGGSQVNVSLPVG
jgi:hypothetical protein